MCRRAPDKKVRRRNKNKGENRKISERRSKGAQENIKTKNWIEIR
jgi:hypothetical protein